MSNLQKYLDLIVECQKEEAALLGRSIRFCLDVTAKIAAAYEKKGIKRLKEINVLDYNGLEEILTSDLIKQIFEYKHDGDYPIWRSFVSNFFPDFAKTIKNPYFAAEQQRIDVSVTEQGEYAFVFENKLKGAVFQRNQLGRYVNIRLTEKFKPEDIYVVIIPGWIDTNFIDKIRKSVWKAPKVWNDPNNDRKSCEPVTSDCFACWCDSVEKHGKDPEWCEGCLDCKSLFTELDGHVKVIDSEFPEFLIKAAQDDSCVPPDEILVRSAMIQFAHYLKGIYNIRLNKEEIMINIEVLKEKMGLDKENPEESYAKVTKTIEEINELQQTLNRLQAICRIKIWQKEIEYNFPDARVDSEAENFGVLIKGIYCGVWIGKDNTPYWGFYRKPNAILSEDQKDMVDQIVRKTTDETKGSSDNFLAWDYTEHGADRVAAFLNAAVDLGFGYQRKYS